METVLIVCAVLFTIAVVVVAVFLVQMLIQARRTAHEAEALLKNLNEEMAVIKKITDILSSITESFNSPLFKVTSWVTGMVSNALKKRKCTEDDTKE